MRTIWDHNLHFGLWTSEEDEAPNRVAAERMSALHIDKLGARLCTDAFDAAWAVETLPHLGNRLSVLRVARV
jgi:hypothetical protein